MVEGEGKSAPIVAKYNYSSSDYMELCRAQTILTGRGALRRAGIWLVIGALFGFSNGWFDNVGTNFGLARATSDKVILLLTLSVPLVAAVLFGWAIAGLSLPVLRWFTYPKLSIAGKPVTFELADAGIAWTRPGQAGTIAWSAFKGIVERPEALVLFLGKVEGVVLPRRGFAAGDFEAARKLAHDKVAQDNAAKSAASA